MLRRIGIVLSTSGLISCLAAGASALTCTPGTVQTPAKCVGAHEDPLKQNDQFPNCYFSTQTAECEKSTGSVCGAFDGYGQPIEGKCQFVLNTSNPAICQEGISQKQVTLHYWRGSCDWDPQRGDCACVFVVDATIPTAKTTLCNCSIVGY